MSGGDWEGSEQGWVERFLQQWLSDRH